MRKRGSLYRRAAAIMLVLAMLFGMTGCRLFRKSKAEQAVEYMNAKYDDEFIFKYYTAGDSKSFVNLKSKKFPDSNIQANCSRKKDGTCYDFIDNYVYCKYEDKTREFLQDFFEDVFECEIKVQYGIGGGIPKNDFDDKTTFEKYLHDSQNCIGSNIMVSNKFNLTSEKQIEDRLKNLANQNNVLISCGIYFAESDSNFEKGFDDLANFSDLPQVHLMMKNHNEYVYVDWRNID